MTEAIEIEITVKQEPEEAEEQENAFEVPIVDVYYPDSATLVTVKSEPIPAELLEKSPNACEEERSTYTDEECKEESRTENTEGLYNQVPSKNGPYKFNQTPASHIKPYRLKRFICDICKGGYTTKCSLIRHLASHRSEKKFPCEYCDKSYTTPINAREHMRTHTGERPYKCELCQMTFGRGNSFYKHQRMHCKDLPTCERCFEKYNPNTMHVCKQDRDRARGVPGKTNKDLECDICHKIFSSKCTLQHHLRAHSGLKPYQCRVCHRAYSNKISAVEHMRTHTGERPHVCAVCKASFARKKSYIKHLTFHCKVLVPCDQCSGKYRPGAKHSCGDVVKKVSWRHRQKKEPSQHWTNKCNECGKVYSSKSGLTRHQLTHNKKLQCPHCEKSFENQPLLDQHSKEHDCDNVNADKVFYGTRYSY